MWTGWEACVEYSLWSIANNTAAGSKYRVPSNGNMTYCASLTAKVTFGPEVVEPEMPV